MSPLYPSLRTQTEYCYLVAGKGSKTKQQEEILKLLKKMKLSSSRLIIPPIGTLYVSLNKAERAKAIKLGAVHQTEKQFAKLSKE